MEYAAFSYIYYISNNKYFQTSNFFFILDIAIGVSPEDLHCDYIFLSPKIKADPQRQKTSNQSLSLPILSQRLSGGQSQSLVKE